MCTAPQPDWFLLRLIPFSFFPSPQPTTTSSVSWDKAWLFDLSICFGLASLVDRRQVLDHQKVPLCPSGQIKATTE